MNPHLKTLAAMMIGASSLHAATISVNSGSLGSAANGTNTDSVVLNQPGALGYAGDTSDRYTGGSQGAAVNTTVAFNSALNPSSTSPFTIEFWVKPDSNVTDALGPSPVFNRVSTGNRSGWVFFQRSQSTGFDFAMYNGNGSTIGKDLVGGSYTAGVWTMVTVTYDGSTPLMYINGALVNATLSGAGGYSASASAVFSVGAYDTGANPFNGNVDETAFYGTALTATQIAAHYNAAASTNPTAYSSLVTGDGALLYLHNAQVPEPAAAGLALLSLAPLLRRRRA